MERLCKRSLLGSVSVNTSWPQPRSRSLLPATSRHAQSWHRAPLGPMAIYLFNDVRNTRRTVRSGVFCEPQRLCHTATRGVFCAVCLEAISETSRSRWLAVWERRSWASARRPSTGQYSLETAVRKCSPWAVKVWGIAFFEDRNQAARSQLWDRRQPAGTGAVEDCEAQ
jgi:hypothetical protein